jgi:hypothetical protein
MPVELVHQSLSAVARLIRVPKAASKAIFGLVAIMPPNTGRSLTRNVAIRVDSIPAAVQKHFGGKYLEECHCSISSDGEFQ